MSRMLSVSFDSRDETYLDTRIFLVIVDKGVARKQTVVELGSESNGRSTPVLRIVYRVGGYLHYLLRYVD